MRTKLLAVAVTGVLVLGGIFLLRAAAAPPTAAAGIDLPRYLGRWYVIARAPGQRDVEAYFEFRWRDDGAIDEWYHARSAFDRPPEARARVARPEPGQPSRWEVRGGWFSSARRLVLYVSPDYRLALAGNSDQSAAWVLARDPEIPEWSYAGLLTRLALQGYDVARLKRVRQKPEQTGWPGYEK